MAMRGDYLTIRLQQHSSGTTNEVVADTISCSMDFSGEALDTTSQDDGLIADFIAGKLSATVSGDYLLMADAEQFSNLFTHISAGNTVEVELYQNSTSLLSCDAIITSLALGGANSDSLATGAYSMQVTGVIATVSYGPELHISANAASDPNGNEADAVTGWTEAGLTGGNTFESRSTPKTTGSYAMLASANATPTSNAWFNQSFTVEAGESYYITFDWRHVGAGGDWDLDAETDGNTIFTITSSETDWASKSFTIVAADTSLLIRFRERSVTNDGGINMDNFSIRKIL